MADTLRLILASGSEGRRNLLTKAGYTFEVMPSGVDEPSFEGVTDPQAYVKQTATLKAAAVADRLKGQPVVVLAADSIVWHQGKIIGKPVDEADARHILSSLCGTTHELWTGVALFQVQKNWRMTWEERSIVAARRLSEPELNALLATGDWKDKSGAYAIQEEGDDPFLTVVDGTVSNVVGLPLESLERMLKLLGIEPNNTLATKAGTRR
jgi:septum formation protein